MKNRKKKKSPPLDNQKSRWYRDSALLLRAPTEKSTAASSSSSHWGGRSTIATRSEWCGRRSAPDPVSPSPPEAQFVCDLVATRVCPAVCVIS